MTHVITAAAVRPRHLAVATIVSALLGGLVFMAMFPSMALAAQNNDVRFGISSTAGTDVGFPGNWTREPGGVVRTKTSRGDISLFVNDNVDGGVCIRLLAAKNGSRLGDLQCWPPGTYGAKVLATHVLAKTRFTVWATKLHSSPTNNVWGGYHTALNPWRGGYLYY
jgi:hypothetical protein